jgi:hypothetical protein
VLVAALGGVGLLGELNDLLARLRAERAERACVAVVVPIKRSAAEAARRLVEEGPPFDVEGLGLERHHVFVSEGEVVFFFEGDNASAAVDALLRSWSPSEPEPDPRPRVCPTRCLAQAKHPNRPFVLHDGQVVEAVLGHQSHRRLDWRGG